MKHIYLIRHGQTDWNKLGRRQGQESDLELNDNGREESKLTGSYLKEFRMSDNEPFDIIISSPMKRAMETAEIIKSAIGYNKNIEYMDELKEKKMGNLVGLTGTDAIFIEFEDNIAKISPIDPILKYITHNEIVDQVNKQMELKMELNSAVRKRIQPVIDYIINTNHKKIIIVAHAVSLQEMIKCIFKIPEIPRGKMKNECNCWISYITYDNIGGFDMISPINTEHLNL